MRSIVPITLEKIKLIAHHLAVGTMDWDEPIPEFETRFPNVLESCVITPFQKFNKKYLYRGLPGKAAILFYLLIKNHPFQNGNKRLAMTTLLVFLHLNNRWLEVDIQTFYNTAVWVAQSPAEAKEEIVKYIEKFIIKYLE
ncbi:MAG TPA: type II toxin-antitoxin system death-on-curing family toxin [bacterium]|nr:type II toxin-antitoxin system death-on-curing family toxin [bacterium]